LKACCTQNSSVEFEETGGLNSPKLSSAILRLISMVQRRRLLAEVST
jgi:hypothetical protein